MPNDPSLPPCPGCFLPLATGAPATVCPRCALPLTGPALDRVREIDAELWRLDSRRGELLAQRGRLLSGLRATAHASGPYGSAAPPGPEAAPRTVRNVLLALGGALLAVAVAAFTLVGWGRMGIGGRAAVLGVLTLVALGAPVLLLRRTLTATAEAVAALGLVLLALDAYALHRVALPGTDDTGYAAVVCAVLAALWTGYGLVLPRPGLRGPLPVAVCCAQLPLLLWAVAADSGPYAFAWALLVTAAGDAALALWATGRGARPVAVTAVVAGCTLGAPGLLLAASLALAAPDWPASAHAAALLGTAAAVLLYAARRHPGAAVALSAAAGLAVLVAGGGALRGVLPGPHWPVLGFALCAVALAAVPVGAASVGAAVRTGLRLASAVVLTGTGLWALPAVALAVLGPMGWTVRVWEGAPPGARAAVAPGTVWPGGMVVPAVLGVLAVTLGAAVRGPLLRAPGVWRARAAAGALVLGSAAVVTLPVALDLRYRVAVALLVALVVLLLAVSVSAAGHTAPPKPLSGLSEPPGPPGPSGLPGLSELLARVALGAALVLGLTAGCWALADRTVTVTVLAALAAAFTAAAVTARSTAAVGPVTAVASVLWTAALAGAVPAALGVPAHRTAFAVLGVAVATAPTAARLRERPTGLPVECAGYGVAAVALALTLAEPAALSLALALCGVAATGVALRADRRRGAAYLGTALLVLAWWVRLDEWEVAVPEAYTVPVTVPALVIGYLRRRQRPDLSSWTAYGGGLAATFVPGVAALDWDTHWLRPLLLGTAALVVTVLGARLRLRAPLLLGGGVLALVAGHELAPHVVQVMGLLPRWAPPAAAGALLLAVGATYERRLRDVRRLRESVGRMR